MMCFSRWSILLFALQFWAGGACARPGIPGALRDPRPARVADTAPAPASAVLRLSIDEALQGALARAVVIQTQQLYVQQQQAQTEQAAHEFLPQTVLSSQLTGNSAAATGVGTARGTVASGNLVSTWKLRSGTQLLLSEGREYKRYGHAPAEGLAPAGRPQTGVRVSSLSLTQPLARGSGGDVVLLGERRATLALERARKDFLQTRRDVVLGGVVAYFGLEQAQQIVTLARAALRRAVETKSINEELLAAGRISRIALLQSDADVAQAELALMQSRQAEKVARSQLLRTIGRHDLDAERTDVTLTDSFAAYLPLQTQGQDAVMRDALARRVDLDRMAAAVNEARFGVVAADDGMRDALDLYVRRDRAPGMVTRSSNLTIGLSYSTTLDKFASRLAAGAARVALRKAELSWADLERTARAEVSDALNNIDFAFLQNRMAQRTAELARQRLTAEIEKVRAGRSSATELSLAQDTLNEALFQEVQARFAIFTAQLELQRVSGTVLEQWHVESLVLGIAPPNG